MPLPGQSRTAVVVLAPHLPTIMDGLSRQMVAVSAKSWGLPLASVSMNSPDMMGFD